MKRYLCILVCAVLMLLLSTAAFADFQYDPETGILSGTYDADFAEIWVDGALAGADHISIEVPKGEHLIEVYDDGVPVYSEILSTDPQAETAGEEGADQTAEDTDNDDGERWVNPVTADEDENGNVIMMYGDTVVYNEEDAVLPDEIKTIDEGGQEESETDASRADSAETSVPAAGQAADAASDTPSKGGSMLLPITIAIVIIIVVVAVDITISTKKSKRGA